MFKKEREEWIALVVSEREAHRKERQELLNRIAQPHVPRVDPPAAPIEPQGMTVEDMEFAFIGREVPDGVSIGSLRDDDTG